MPEKARKKDIENILWAEFVIKDLKLDFNLTLGRKIVITAYIE